MTQNKVNQLVINKVESLEVYEALKKKGLSDEEIYLLTPEGIQKALDEKASEWKDIKNIPDSVPRIEEGEITEIFPSTTLNVTEDDGIAFLTEPIGFVSGFTYTINYNGTEYECLASEFEENGLKLTVLGNFGLMLGGDDTGEPFIIAEINDEKLVADLGGIAVQIIPLDGSLEMIVSISGPEIVLHKVDERLLPDMSSYFEKGSSLGSMRHISSMVEGTLDDGTEYVIGELAFAEGFDAIASGVYSHAEGERTVASGISSHAEGSVTTASGDSSHAEGSSTTASGIDSHAEGSNTTASGYASHAEGQVTEASGDYSHAEGRRTKASGSHSHAEGNNTTASGLYSHAEGEYTTASKYGSHAEGGARNNNGNSILSDLNLTITDYSDFLTKDVTVKGSLAAGIQSHAEGTQTYAHGYSSHAEGYQTKAFGEKSHAEGEYTIASGISSHAEGGDYSSYVLSATEYPKFLTKDITIKGSIAAGNYSHTEGSNTYAHGTSSHAEGYGTKAFGMESHAEGNKTTASGSQSHAEGSVTTASGNNSHAEGWITTASGNNSHAEGYDSTASGDYSHAEGYTTITNGASSHAEGQYSTANGDGSHAEGRGSYANGDESHAEGYTTTADGESSHAEGNSTTASGDASHAEGQGTIANGYGSHTEGSTTIASSDYQHVQGKYNVEDDTDTYAHIVGNGTAAARSNAHTLDWSGNAWFKGNVYVGSTSGTNKDTGSKKLATEEFVTQEVGKINIPTLTKGTDATATAQTLTPSTSTKKVSFTAMTDTTVSGHTVTDKNTTFTLDLSGFVIPSDLDKFSTSMVFKGTLGTGGTITALPTASNSIGSSTVGHTYKVITAGTYASIAAKVGDVFTCSTEPAWVLIPSGDEPAGTVTNISQGVDIVCTPNPITSSGTISHANITRSDPAVGNALTPGYGGTFNVVESVTSSARGHVTAVQIRKVNMPAAQSLNKKTATVLTSATTISHSGGVATTNKIKATASGTAAGANGTANVITGYPNITNASFVNGITNTTTTVVNGVSNTTAKALTGLGTASTVAAVTGYTPTNASFVNGVTNTTTSVVNSVTSGTISVSNGILTIPKVTMLTGSSTTTVINKVSSTSGKALTGLGTPATSSVVTGYPNVTNASFVNSVSKTTTSVVNSVSSTSGKALTGLGTPTTATALTGVKITTQPTIKLEFDATNGQVSVVTGVSTPSVTLNKNTDDVLTDETTLG